MPEHAPEFKGRLAGHELPDEGRLYLAGFSHRDGAAQCTCGAWSPDLPSQKTRQRWHRQHKARVVAADAG